MERFLLMANLFTEMANSRYKRGVMRKSSIPFKLVGSKLTTSVILSIIIIFILLLFTDYILLSYKDLKPDKLTNTCITPPIYPPVFLNNASLISMKVPAVDTKGNGITTFLVVEAMPGSGRTLVDIDNLLFWADTQQSIRTARKVAANITQLDINNYDLIYNIHANATVIGGQSAGAAITIATIAALQNKNLEEGVMITGTINHDGTIGPVSEILAKARAAKQSGFSLFLVPLLQSGDIIYETTEHCEKFGITQVCTVEQIPKRVDVSNQSGIEVIEVGSINEALPYFISE